MSIVPPNRPKLTPEDAAPILQAHPGVDTSKCVLIGIRGYYKRSMGNPEANDAHLYDDAMVVVSPDTFRTFNANTDPEHFDDNLAKLDTGVYEFYKGLHHPSSPHRYNALRTFPEGRKLPVTRTNNGKTVRSLAQYINIHKGGTNATYSAGCQTIVPAQYDEFIKLVYAEMTKYDQKTIHYILIEN